VYIQRSPWPRSVLLAVIDRLKLRYCVGLPWRYQLAFHYLHPARLLLQSNLIKWIRVALPSRHHSTSLSHASQSRAAITCPRSKKSCVYQRDVAGQAVLNNSTFMRMSRTSSVLMRCFLRYLYRLNYFLKNHDSAQNVDHGSGEWMSILIRCSELEFWRITNY
jgi:hypothetical protein